MPYSKNLKLYYPGLAECNWGYGWYDAERIKDLAIGQISKGNYVQSGGVLSNAVGLDIDMSEVVAIINGNIFQIPATTITVSASNTPIPRLFYIYINSAGNLTATINAPSDENIAFIGIVYTNPAAIESFGDLRLFAYQKEVNEPGVNLFRNANFQNWKWRKTNTLAGFGENDFAVENWRAVGVVAECRYGSFEGIPYLEMVATSAGERDYNVYQMFTHNYETESFRIFNPSEKKYVEFEYFYTDNGFTPDIIIESSWSGSQNYLTYPPYSPFYSEEPGRKRFVNNVTIEEIEAPTPNKWIKVIGIIEEDHDNIDFPAVNVGGDDYLPPPENCYQHIKIGFNIPSEESAPIGSIFRIRNAKCYNGDELVEEVKKNYSSRKDLLEESVFVATLDIVQKDTSGPDRIAHINFNTRLTNNFVVQKVENDWNFGNYDGFIDHDSTGAIPEFLGTTSLNGTLNIYQIVFDRAVPFGSRFTVPIKIYYGS